MIDRLSADQRSELARAFDSQDGGAAALCDTHSHRIGHTRAG